MTKVNNKQPNISIYTSIRIFKNQRFLLHFLHRLNVIPSAVSM